MADPNPLDALLHSETDESVVNALVASLESRLTSPTHKEQSLGLSNPSVNSNHVSNATSNSACTTPQISAQNNVHLPNANANFNNSNAKSAVKDSQILGINSIHSSVTVASSNTPVNSQRTASPKPLNTVNKPSSPAIQIITHSNNGHGAQIAGVNAHLQRTTPSPVSTTVNNIAVQQNSVSMTIPQTLGAQIDSVINRTSSSPSPHLNTSVQQGLVQQNVVRNPQGVVINSNSSQPLQKTNVHIVHGTNVTAMLSQPGSNPSVITVRGQMPTSQITSVRPQIVTSNLSTPSPRPPTNVRIQTTSRMPNAPIRIASSTAPNQITIAPRPGAHPGTITLPPGLVHSPNAVLVKNEQGQIVIVQPGQQHPASSVSISTSSTPQKLHYVRHANAGTPQRLPSGQILIQQGSQPVVRQSTPSPVPTVRTQPGVRVTMPTNVQTVRATTATSGTGGGGQQHAAQAAAQHQQQQMVENVKKCKNFLSTLIKLAASQPEAIVSNVRDLIQGLIDGKLEPEVFTEQLQKELKSSPQPYLVPFLKKSLPLLRQSLLNNKMTIDGVKPPPLDIIQQTPPTTIAPPTITVSQHQAIPKVVRSKHSSSKPAIGKPALNKQVNMAGGNIPATLKAFQSKVAGFAPSSSPGPSHSHKDNKRVKESFKDDDDINDVATMGGVNLSEESKNILATNSELIGSQIRSCKDETFLHQGPLMKRLHVLASRHGISEVPTEVANLISHATQERLRHIVEKLSTVAEQRTEIYKMNEKFSPALDVKAQLKFLEELDVLERKRHDEQEKEMLRRAAKSRSKHEDPEHLKLKQRAKDMQNAEQEEVRQREANLTALAAIGPRKKRKLEETAASSGSVSNGPSSSSRSSLRPRIKRVNLRDLLFLMEQDKTLSKSNTLYRTFLK